MARILNYGSLNIDHVYSVPHIVRPGETISAAGFNDFPGGKGLNQSVAMARAGAAVFHAGKIGNDGGFLKKILAAEGVDCTWLKESGGPNGSAVIQKDTDGQNAIICYAGSNGEIRPAEIDEVLDDFEEGDILVSQNEISNVPYLLEMAGKRGMRIAFNPSPIDDTVLHMDLSMVSWLIINETEGYGLTGEKEPEKMVKNLITRYPEMAVILTLGEDGSIYCKGDSLLRQAAYRFEVKDTTAAGDTYLGYFLGTYELEGDVKAALDMAARAAGIAVSREGAVPSIPRAEEVRDYEGGRKRCQHHTIRPA